MRKIVATAAITALAAGLFLSIIGWNSSNRPPRYSCYVISGTADTTLVFPNVMGEIAIENLGSVRCRYSIHVSGKTYPVTGDTNYVLSAGGAHAYDNADANALVLHRGAGATDVLVIAKE